VLTVDGDDDRLFLARFGAEQLELEAVVGHAQHAEARVGAVAAHLKVDFHQLRAAQRQHIECGQHGGVTPVEVAVAKACQDVAEDGGTQGRRLALLARGLPAGTGKGTQQIGVRAVEALAGNLVAELDGGQRHGEGRPGGAGVGALQQPRGDNRRGDGRRVDAGSRPSRQPASSPRECDVASDRRVDGTTDC
jgi:hypothetical protein